MSKKSSSEPQLVVYKPGKHHFEVAVEGGSNLFEEYRASSSTKGLQSLLSSSSIYTSFHKGQLASSEELRSVFDLKSNNEILDIIVRQGQYQASISDKRAAAANFREEILQYIHDHYVNKQTKLPIQINELNKLVDESKITINNNSDFDRAVEHVVHEILTHSHITLKQGDITGSIELKADLVPQAMNVIHKFSRIKNETQTWFGDEMKYRVSIKPGDYNEFRGALDKLTKGDYKFELGQIESHESENSSSVSSNADAVDVARQLKEERKADLKAANLAKESLKQEIRASKQADANRSRKESGKFNEDEEVSSA